VSGVPERWVGIRSCQNCATVGVDCCRASGTRSCCDKERHLGEATTGERAGRAVGGHRCPATEGERARAITFGTPAAVALELAAAAGGGCRHHADELRAQTEAGFPTLKDAGVAAGAAGAPGPACEAADVPTEDGDLTTAVAKGAARASPAAACDAADIHAQAGAEDTFTFENTADSHLASSAAAGLALPLAWEVARSLVGGACCHRDVTGGDAEGAVMRASAGRQGKATGEDVRRAGEPRAHAKSVERKDAEFDLVLTTGDCAAPSDGCRAEALRCTTLGDNRLHVLGDANCERGACQGGEHARVTPASWASEEQRDGGTGGGGWAEQEGLQQGAGESSRKAGFGSVRSDADRDLGG